MTDPDTSAAILGAMQAYAESVERERDALRDQARRAEAERDAWARQVGRIAALVPLPDVVKCTGTTNDLIEWLTGQIALAAERDALRAEVERLREALRSLVDRVEDRGADKWMPQEVRRARAALTSTEPD